MKKVLLLLLTVFTIYPALRADLPFRRQRYNCFAALPTNNKSIVFMGNSIINWHEWWEAFDNPHIVNRGVGGAVSEDMLDNLESILRGQPAKIFLMMGTNDLGTEAMNTPAFVARNARTILQRIKSESPRTRLYVQSILPTKAGLRYLINERDANDSLRKISREVGATYIDLWNDFTCLTQGEHTLDGLHPTASGYRIWCQKLAPYVGSKCVYLDDQADNTCTLRASHGARCTILGFLPVRKGDILIIGDGNMNGGEWHELLHSPRVKKRTSSWEMPGPDILTMQKMLPNILKGRPDNEEPAQIHIQLGFAETHRHQAPAEVARTYNAFLHTVRAYAPHAPLFVHAVYPSDNPGHNIDYIKPLNRALQELADTMAGVTFIPETYTELEKDGRANPAFFTGINLYAMGYAKLSQILARYMGPGVRPLTDAEAQANLSEVHVRNALGAAIGDAEAVQIGRGVGQYTPENARLLTGRIREAYALLSKQKVTEAELTSGIARLHAETSRLLPLINRPYVSVGDDEHWYQLFTPLRSNRCVAMVGEGRPLTGSRIGGRNRTMWKFVARPDSTYDIVCRADNTFLSPNSDHNTSLYTTAERPAAGWTIGISNEPGLFTVSSGEGVQLNITRSDKNYAVFNWGKRRGVANRDNAGCKFAIADAFTPVSDLPAFIEGNIAIDMNNGSFSDPDEVFQNTWTLNAPEEIALSFTCPKRNIRSFGNDLVIYPGLSGSSTFTIQVSPGYYIVDCYFKALNNGGHNTPISLSFGYHRLTTSPEPQDVIVSQINSQYARITLSGDNEPVCLQDFEVTVRRHQSIASGNSGLAAPAPASPGQ